MRRRSRSVSYLCYVYDLTAAPFGNCHCKSSLTFSTRWDRTKTHRIESSLHSAASTDAVRICVTLARIPNSLGNQITFSEGQNRAHRRPPTAGVYFSNDPTAQFCRRGVLVGPQRARSARAGPNILVLVASSVLLSFPAASGSVTGSGRCVGGGEDVAVAVQLSRTFSASTVVVVTKDAIAPHLSNRPLLFTNRIPFGSLRV